MISLSENDNNIVYVDGVEYNLNNSEHIDILGKKFLFQPKMSEQKFFAMFDVLDEIPFKNINDDFLPSAEDFKKNNIEGNLEKYIPYLVYLSEHYENKDYIEYKKFRKRVNELVEQYID